MPRSEWSSRQRPGGRQPGCERSAAAGARAAAGRGTRLRSGTLESPSVGVVLPVYRVADYVEECVDSIGAQTVRPAHVVVVDDRGGDQSVELAVRRLRHHGLSHEVLTQPVNRGLGAARNDGAARLGTDLIWFLDSDDTAEPGMIEALRDALVASDAGMATCRTRRVIDDQRGTGVRAGSIDEPTYRAPWCAGADFSRGLLRGRFTAYAPTKLFRRVAIPATLWDEGRAYEDFAPMVRFGLSVPKVALVDQPLYRYRWRASSLSARYGPHTCDLFGVEASVEQALADAGRLAGWRTDWVGYRYREVLLPVAHLAMRALDQGGGRAGAATEPVEALEMVRDQIDWADLPRLLASARLRPLAFAVLVKLAPPVYRAVLRRR